MKVGAGFGRDGKFTEGKDGHIKGYMRQESGTIWNKEPIGRM